MMQEDIRLGKKLASGGFGTVFRGELLDIYPEAELPVVVKKVRPFCHGSCVACFLSARS